MKRTSVLFSLFLGSVLAVSAQQATSSAPAASAEISRQNPKSKLGTAGIKKETYAGGVFSRTYKNGRELRLINPLYLNPAAPAALGNGADNLVYNPFTHTAEGVALFSYRF